GRPGPGGPPRVRRCLLELPLGGVSPCPPGVQQPQPTRWGPVWRPGPNEGVTDQAVQVPAGGVSVAIFLGLAGLGLVPSKVTQRWAENRVERALALEPAGSALAPAFLVQGRNRPAGVHAQG